jgi:acyl dehydratase
MPKIIGTREFTDRDQEWFAAVSGDRNPMHMDAVVARRTIAQFPVVHGIHTLLWALDALFETFGHDFIKPQVQVKANFASPVLVNDHARVILIQDDDGTLRIKVMVAEVTAIRIEITFGKHQPVSEYTIVNGPSVRSTEPLNLTFDQMTGSHGAIPFSAGSAEIAQRFPAAARALDARRLSALACSSFLVGMICPGLHSIYSGLELVATAFSDDSEHKLRFGVVESDARFRLVRLAVSGGGWTGLLEAQARPEPVGQADLASIATRVSPGEFSEVSALVVGGSRGLGELVAKILAAGNAHTTITYAVGEADARHIQGEITAFGGRCEVLHYDVRSSAQAQLDRLTTTPNQVYFMATPAISRHKRVVFMKDLFQEFLSFYVKGFYDLCNELVGRYGRGLSFFYPSSMFVDARPRNMTEYAMAKACGEVLCTDMRDFEKLGRILVRRLPRLLTDQTATIVGAQSADPVDVMISIVRELHADLRPNRTQVTATDRAMSG